MHAGDGQVRVRIRAFEKLCQIESVAVATRGPPLIDTLNRKWPVRYRKAKSFAHSLSLSFGPSVLAVAFARARSEK